MGGVRAPSRPFQIKASKHTLDMKPEIIIKEVPCSKQAGDIVHLKGLLADQGDMSLNLRAECRKLEIKNSDLDGDLKKTKAILVMAEKRLEKPNMDEKGPELEAVEVKIPVLDKKMLIIYTLAALASGLGIGVML